MADKNLAVSYLLDFYGDILTDKQKEVCELYYNEDLSLSEIADIAGITRQGVRDSIKRGEMTMFEMEEKLGIAKLFFRVRDGLSQIEQLAHEVEEVNLRFGARRDITQKLSQIIDLTDKLSQLGVRE